MLLTGQPRNRVSIPGMGKTLISFSGVNVGCGSHRSSYSKKAGALPPVLKRPRYANGHSPPSTPKVLPYAFRYGYGRYILDNVCFIMNVSLKIQKCYSYSLILLLRSQNPGVNHINYYNVYMIFEDGLTI